MKKSVYRHFGSSKFDRELFNPIHNRPFSNKPFGGLWACPVEDKDIDWEEWCRREEFNLESLEEHFDFTIKDDSKIMVIKDIKDLDKLPRVKNPEFILEYDTEYDTMKRISIPCLPAKEVFNESIFLRKEEQHLDTQKVLDQLVFTSNDSIYDVLDKSDQPKEIKDIVEQYLQAAGIFRIQK